MKNGLGIEKDLLNFPYSRQSAITLYTMTDFSQSFDTVSKLTNALTKVIRGRSDTIQLILAALAADGHVLLEDYPGSGKTVLTKTLGGLIARDSVDRVKDQAQVPEHIVASRIQFTPDLLPGDVLGVNVFDPKAGQFNFLHEPYCSHSVGG